MKILKSSTRSGNLSLTVKGLFLALIPITISVANYYGIILDENILLDGVEQLFTAISAVMVLFGLARKIYYSIK